MSNLAAPHLSAHLAAQVAARHSIGSFRFNVPIDATLLQRLTSEVVRRNEASLSQTQQAAFLHAFDRAIVTGVIGNLVAVHGNMAHRQHSMTGPVGTQRFLPWHRVFLYILEGALRSVDPAVAIPYWDWVNARAIPGWLANYTPTVPIPAYQNDMPGMSSPTQVPAQQLTVTRHPQQDATGLPGDGLPSIAMVQTIEAQTTYDAFTTPVTDANGDYVSPYGLEGLHNAVHLWVGGTMEDIPTAPADPIFWLHHANVDRLWAQWQSSNNDGPTLTGVDAEMDPWNSGSQDFTATDTRNTGLLHYSYA